MDFTGIWKCANFAILKICENWRFSKYSQNPPHFFFSNVFCFSMNFRTSFTSCRENWTVFRPKKCIFCKMDFGGNEKIQKIRSNKVNEPHFPSRNPSFFHLKLSVLHFKTVLKFLKFNPITYGGANVKNQLFLDFFITDDIGFAKNTLFGPKNGSIFPATRKTSSKNHWKAKNFRKKKFGGFCEIIENRQFSKISKIAKFSHFQMPVKSKPEKFRIQFFPKM